MNLFALKTAAQNKVKSLTNDKIKFTLEKNEQGRNEMVMYYSYYNVAGDYITSNKKATLSRDSRDNMFQVDLLLHFIMKRVDFLNASYYWQMKSQVANVHPEYFKQWFDGIKAGKSENDIFAEVPRLITFG